MKKNLLLIPALLLVLTSCNVDNTQTSSTTNNSANTTQTTNTTTTSNTTNTKPTESIGNKVSKDDIYNLIEEKNYQLPSSYIVNVNGETEIENKFVSNDGEEQTSTTKQEVSTEFAYDFRDENDYYLRSISRNAMIISSSGIQTSTLIEYTKKTEDGYVAVSIQDGEVSESNTTKEDIVKAASSFAQGFILSKQTFDSMLSMFFSDKEPEFYINSNDKVTIQGEGSMNTGVDISIDAYMQIRFDEFGMLTYLNMANGTLETTSDGEDGINYIKINLSMKYEGSSNCDVAHIEVTE